MSTTPHQTASEVLAVQHECSELRAELDVIRAERDALAAECARLRAELEQVSIERESYRRKIHAFAALPCKEFPYTKEEILATLDQKPTFQELIEELERAGEAQQ